LDWQWVALLGSAQAAFAQEIKVQQTAGATQGSGQATLALRATDGQQVSVRRVHQELQTQVTSNFGYSASGIGDLSTAICVTPCKLSLPNGFYKLRFGDANPMNANGSVDFNLGPGDHAYRIKPFSGGKFVGGFLLTLVGGTAAMMGTNLALVIEADPFKVARSAGAACRPRILGGNHRRRRRLPTPSSSAPAPHARAVSAKAIGKRPSGIDDFQR
jgi:hypothetical protein